MYGRAGLADAISISLQERNDSSPDMDDLYYIFYIDIKMLL